MDHDVHTVVRMTEEKLRSDDWKEVAEIEIEALGREVLRALALRRAELLTNDG